MDWWTTAIGVIAIATGILINRCLDRLDRQQGQIADIKDILDRHLAVLNEQQNWIRRLESKIGDLERK